MSARAEAIAQCRAILAPGFAAYWDRVLTRRDRQWVMQCVGIGRRRDTWWASFTPDEQNALRSAWAAFMNAGASDLP